MGNPPPVLSLRNLRVKFREVCALDLEGLEIQDEPSSLHFFMGPNGAGKTTLLNAVTGYVRAEPASRVHLFGEMGQRLDRLSRPDIIRAGVARTFQAPPVFSSLRVREGLALADLFANARHWYPCPSWRKSGNMIVDELVSTLGINGSAPLGGLSLPMLRRAELGRCLATQPRVLFLDEPTAGADRAEKAFLVDFLNGRLPQLIARLHAEGQYRHGRLTVCAITHDLPFVRAIVARADGAPLVHVLDQGRLLASGSANEVLRDHQVRRIYLGVA